MSGSIPGLRGHADDPIAVVVDMVAAVEPALERGELEQVVRTAAGGRIRQGRLVRALTEDPRLLLEGRSPAPRVVADLLIALRAAGAQHVAVPVCVGCGTPLRSVYTRGGDWLCWACGRPREACTGCGRAHASTGRGGQPEGTICPVEVVVEVVAQLDPTLSSEQVRAAVLDAVPHPSQRHHLAAEVAENPALLTGAGARSSVPTVLRLIDKLCQAGAVRITAPACPACQRVVPLDKHRDGLRVCSRCFNNSRAEPCSRCGAQRPPATRTDSGDPICAACRPRKIMICGICGNSAPCRISRATGKPWCQACWQRWGRCSGCGVLAPIRGGTADQPLCSTCTRPEPGFWRGCEGCGRSGRLRAGRCAHCRIGRRIDQLLADDTGQIPAGLRGLRDALTNHERPASVADWLDRHGAPSVLRGLLDQPLTHQVLDDLPSGAAVEHLRAMLVATGCLPGRDEHLARLERWITATITAHTGPDQQQLLHRYAVWHLLRRLRGRTSGAGVSLEQVSGIRTHVTTAIGLLDWLTEHQLTLATANQGDLDVWLTEAKTPYRGAAGDFIRWAHKQKLTSLELPAIPWTGPTRGIDTETRWQQARWLLHDTTVTPEDRLAGLLVLLYAQRCATIRRLTLDHLDIRPDRVRLRLGDEPVVLPEPLADLVRHLAPGRRGHTALAQPRTNPWLFPGRRPGQPISSPVLGRRLRRLGVQPAQARNAALFQLATDLPAAILARTLGIHIDVAATWQRAAAGDWTTYAADVSRRAPTPPAYPPLERTP